MGEALITRRGGGMKITTATELSYSFDSSFYTYTYQIEPDGIYSVALCDNGSLRLFSGIIVNGEWLAGGDTVGTITGNTLVLEFGSSDLGSAAVYRLE